MKEIIDRFNVQIRQLNAQTRNEIQEYIRNFDHSISTKKHQVIGLKKLQDLNEVYTGPGFYIILTDAPFLQNKCTFELNEHRAIYRGHSINVRVRIMSHLFNTAYQEKTKNSKASVFYKVCLNIGNGHSGIDITDDEHLKYQWLVIVHKMRGSSKLMREQAESAFDEIYNRPFASRENSTL